MKSDLSTITTALVTPLVNQSILSTDLATVFASLDQLFVDQQSQNLVATAEDSAAEFAAMDAAFNDLVAGLRNHLVAAGLDVDAYEVGLRGQQNGHGNGFGMTM